MRSRRLLRSKTRFVRGSDRTVFRHRFLASPRATLLVASWPAASGGLRKKPSPNRLVEQGCGIREVMMRQRMVPVIALFIGVAVVRPVTAQEKWADAGLPVKPGL